MPTITASALRATTTEVQAEARDAGWSARLTLRALTAIVLANGLWFIWSNRFIPMADYPDWVYQGFLFSRMLRGKLPAAFSPKSYPVPNSIPTVAMGLLGFIVAPEVAGKLVMSAAVVLFALASIYFFKSAKIAERNPVYLVPLLFVFNCWFFFGELSYLFGLGLLFLYTGYLIRRLDDGVRLNGWIVFAALLATFFAHPIPFAIALLISALYFLKRPSRDLAIRFSAAGTLPALLAVWFIAGRILHPSSKAVKLWEGWSAHQILGRFLMAFSPFQEFLPWIGISTPGMKLAAAINVALALTAVVALGASVVWLAAERRHASLMLQAAGICSVLFVAAGYSLAGWIGPGERFIYPAAWFALCWVGASWAVLEWRLPMLAAKAAIALLIVAQSLFLDIGVAGVSRQLVEVYASLASAKSRAEFCTIYENSRAQNHVAPHRQGFARFLNNEPIMTRLPYYLYIERAQSAPISPVGLFDYHGAGDVEDLCNDSH
jgi:hypothetical protein